MTQENGPKYPDDIIQINVKIIQNGGGNINRKQINN